MSKLMSTTWELGRDRYGRRVTMTRKDHDFSIEIEPLNQQDDGEIIRSLSRDLLVEAGLIAQGQR